MAYLSPLPDPLPVPAAEPRAVRWLWLAVGLGLLGLAWSAACTVAGVDWNAPRLAPSFALAEGLPIYALRSSGAHLGWIYGPVFPLWFLPVTLAPTLTTAFMLAGALNAATLVLPVFLAVRAALGPRHALTLRLTLLGAALLAANGVTQTALYYVHVDAVCIALGTVAAVALHAAAARGERRAWPVAALALTLAVWTKQTAVMLIPATFFWLWREGHARHARTWLRWLLLVGGGVSVALLAAFGPEEVLFNLWLLPSRNPSAAGLGLLGERLAEAAAGSWLWWLALGLGLRFLQRPAPATESARAAGGALVRLLGGIAVWQLPLGLSAAMKIGGGLNSFHSLTFALLAGLVAAAERLAAGPDAARPQRSHRAALGLALLAVTGVGAGYVFAAGRSAAWLPVREQDVILAEARRRPGALYLPWNPLVTIVADGKIYPFDDALLCLWRAGLEPPRAAIVAAVPPGAEVLYQPTNQSRFALSYFGPDPAPATKP